jgi:uncharacterized protein YkwD
MHHLSHVLMGILALLGLLVTSQIHAQEPAGTPQDRPIYLPLVLATLPGTPDPSPTPAPKLPPVNPSLATEVVRLTNLEREKVGCPVLAASDRLNTAAQNHSNDMASNQFFAHTGSNGTSPWQRIKATGYLFTRAAENIAMGAPTPEEVVARWMESAAHRENILDCNLREIGVGFARDFSDLFGYYWTQDLATPR